MNSNGMMRYTAEYVFQQSVEKLKREHGVMITTTAARELRERHPEINDMGQSKRTAEIVNGMNEIFREYLDGQDLYPPEADGRVNRECAQMQLDYAAMCGFGKNAAQTPMVAVSPYDPRFSGRSAFRRNGAGLMYLSGAEIDAQCGGSAERAADKRVGERLHLYAMDANGKFAPATYRMSKSENLELMATTPDDYSGLARLQPYMSEAEYRSVRRHVNQVGMRQERDRQTGLPVEVLTRPENFMSDESIDKAEGVLRYLRDNGIGYTVKPDRMPGQIMAEIDGTKMSVRLTESRANERFVGRVYDNGVAIMHNTTRVGRDNKPVQYNPTVEDCINQVRFGLGEPIATQLPDVYRGKKGKPAYQAFHTGEKFSYAVRPDGKDAYGNTEVVRLYADATHRSASTRYFTEETAEIYLRDAIQSARDNFTQQVDVERLIRESKEHAGEENYVPEFSVDSGIAAIQHSYWEVLSGRSPETTLLRPGKTADEYYDKVGVDGVERSYMEQMQLEALRYEGTPEEIVRQHAADNVDHLIGQYECRSPEVTNPFAYEAPSRFDPVNVASYMTSEYGRYRNNDDIVAAMKMVGIDPRELKGSDFYNKTVQDRMIQFDPATARPMAESDSPFIRSMHEEICQSIRRNGCELDADQDVLMDANGIVHYTARRQNKASPNTKDALVTVQGEIGQIFEPGDYGAVTTRFAGSDNYMFVPGYEAYVVPQKTGEDKSVEERTRLRGYEQIMRQQIRYQLHNDLMADPGAVPQMESGNMTAPMYGNTTSVNGVYRRLYDERHPVDFMERSREEGLSEDWCRTILETEARRVRYGNDIKEGSTINADYQAHNRAQVAGDDVTVADLSNDNFGDAYHLTGRRNMSIMTADGDGYFDPIVTGTSTNQGITRYLVESAQVNPDGSITRGALDDRCPLMKHPDMRYAGYSPFDRQQMTASNAMRASSVTHSVGVAQMTCGGWTFDDGVVVSKRFADEHQIRGTDGQMRSLMVGDKISDFHGNKGVIPLIVDPDMDPKEAEEQGLTEMVAWFKSNPDLDVMMAPFPSVSRYNGGSARELMESPKDLVSPDGTIHKGSMGEMKFIITHMAVDAKTHVYGEDELAKGKGRKASAQLAWALNSQDCPAIMRECYGPNSGATAGLREMLVATGLDMDATGNLRVGYAPQSPDDKRQVFTMPELAYKGDRVDISRMKKEFASVIEQSGGVLEMPFPLKFPTGEDTPPMNADKTDVVYTEAERSALVGQPGTTYGLPVMSSYLRSGQEFEDGTSTVHDYTNQYLSIYESACRYRAAEAKGDAEEMAKLQQSAQATFSRITDDLVARKFSGKHNVFRDNIMGSRMPHSATAVWTADPRLDIDQVSMGPDMMESLGVKEDDHVLVWRDPMLRDAGVRYLRVKPDERLTGVAINPVMDKSFDGDFDGDSVAVVALKTREAQAEAMARLSIGANLLDYGVRKDDGTYPLSMHDSLDLKVAQHYDPKLKARFDGITAEVNQFEEQGRKGAIAPSDLVAKRKGTVAALNSYYHDALNAEYGQAMGCYTDAVSHLRAVVRDCVETGAKGSLKKVNDYMPYLGVRGFADDLGHAEDAGHSLATRSMSEGVQYATAVKAFGTGVAGMYSIRGITVLRNSCPKAALELTYPVTQSILQAKHDPVDARHKYEFLMGSARELWQGRKMEPDQNGVWRSVKGKDGKPEQATPREWERQFCLMYTGKYGKEKVADGVQTMGVDINPLYVRQVAQALTDKDGRMLDIETSGREQKASTMDKMAYGGNFDALVKMAREGHSVFEGRFNAGFAPTTVRQNVAAEATGADVKVITKSDTGLDGKRKTKVPQMTVREKGAVETRRDIPAALQDIADDVMNKPKSDGDYGDQ